MSATALATYIKHDDPGHGWLAVPMAELRELGIADKITGYSYVSRDRQTAYLEEDCDLSTFWNAYKERHGAAPKWAVVHTNGASFVRSLAGYPS